MAVVMAEQSAQNMEYVRRLLKQKQPGFAAALELAVNLIEREPRCRGALPHNTTSRPCPGTE